MKLLQVDDIEIAVEELGAAGPCLVLVHGLGGSMAVWSRAMPLLARGARVLAIDLRGCGRSTRGTAPWTLARAADDVLGATRALGLDSWIVVGHSLGGVIAQEVLLRHPPSLAGAVLVSTSSKLNEKATANWRRLADIVEARGLDSSAAAQARGFSEEFAARCPEVLEEQARRTATVDPRVYAEQARAAAEYDYTESLASVSCPVLVVQGLADRLTPPGGSVLLHRALPAGSRLEMLAGAGHNLPVETPEHFADLVLSFATGLPGLGSGQD